MKRVRADVHGDRARLKWYAKGAVVKMVNLGGRVPVAQYLNYKLVHLHARHPNPVSTRMLPKDRWPAFWYSAQRLGKSYVPERYEGDVLAVFLDRGERFEMWNSLLGPRTDSRVVETTHLGLFTDSAMAAWMTMLDERLDERLDGSSS